MKNAVIYARYSSEKQTEQSIEGQIRVCKEYAEHNDYNIICIYADRATTGRNDQRAEFQKMLSDSEKHNFEAVLVYKLDRFARNRYDSAHNKSILKKNGVKVVSATENISDNPEGILLESLLEGLAEYYSAELAQKVSRGIRESILKGHWLGGRIPYGFNVIDKKYAINEVEAEIVKIMFNKYIEFKSVQAVVNYLNKQHITNKQNRKFQLTQVRKILSRDLYIGTLRGAGIVLENKIPAIISKDIFYEVNKMLNNNIKPMDFENYILTGKLFCGVCGDAMVGKSGTGRSKTYYYYKCKKNKVSVCKEKIENYVFDALKKFLADSDRIKIISANIDKFLENDPNKEYIENLQKRLNKINNELANISNAIINGIINEDLKQKNEALKQEREQVIFELERLNRLDNFFNGNLVVDFLQSMSNSIYEDDKGRLINILVNKVVYTKEKTLIYLNLSPNSPSIGNNEVLELVNGSSEISIGLPNGFIKEKVCFKLSFFISRSRTLGFDGFPKNCIIFRVGLP